MTNKNYKLSDLVKAAGGLSSLGYAKGARLERKMTDEERQQQEASLRASQITLYEESMQSDNKNFDFNRASAVLLVLLTSIHYWKNHSLDYMDLCQQSDISFYYTVYILIVSGQDY